MMAISTIGSGIIFNVNNAFMSTLGYSLKELSGKSVQELGLFYDDVQRQAILNQYRNEGRAEGEVSLKAKSGQLIVCLFRWKR